MARTGVIYLINNIINNKKYIGSTCSDIGFKARSAQHKSALNRNNHCNTYLQNSWNKYGQKSFEFIILEECYDDILILREQFWIDYYQSMNFRNGYNLREAGRGGKLGLEGRKKISEALKGKKKSPEHCKKLSEAHKGVKLSEERKLRQSKRMMGHYVSEETKQKLKGHPNYLIKHSEQTKVKIGLASRGNQYALGSKHTEEWKKNLRLNLILRKILKIISQKL